MPFNLRDLPTNLIALLPKDWQNMHGKIELNDFVPAIPGAKKRYRRQNIHGKIELNDLVPPIPGVKERYTPLLWVLSDACKLNWKDKLTLISAFLELGADPLLVPPLAPVASAAAGTAAAPNSDAKAVQEEEVVNQGGISALEKINQLKIQAKIPLGIHEKICKLFTSVSALPQRILEKLPAGYLTQNINSLCIPVERKKNCFAYREYLSPEIIQLLYQGKGIHYIDDDCFISPIAWAVPLTVNDDEKISLIATLLEHGTTPNSINQKLVRYIVFTQKNRPNILKEFIIAGLDLTRPFDINTEIAGHERTRQIPQTIFDMMCKELQKEKNFLNNRVNLEAIRNTTYALICSTIYGLTCASVKNQSKPAITLEDVPEAISVLQHFLLDQIPNIVIDYVGSISQLEEFTQYTANLKNYNIVKAGEYFSKAEENLANLNDDLQRLEAFDNLSREAESQAERRAMLLDLVMQSVAMSSAGLNSSSMSSSSSSMSSSSSSMLLFSPSSPSYSSFGSAPARQAAPHNAHNRDELDPAFSDLGDHPWEEPDAFFVEEAPNGPLMDAGESVAEAADAAEVNVEDVGCCFPGLAAKSKEKMKKLWQVTKESFRESARAYKKF